MTKILSLKLKIFIYLHKAYVKMNHIPSLLISKCCERIGFVNITQLKTQEYSHAKFVKIQKICNNEFRLHCSMICIVLE